MLFSCFVAVFFVISTEYQNAAMPHCGARNRAKAWLVGALVQTATLDQLQLRLGLRRLLGPLRLLTQLASALIQLLNARISSHQTLGHGTDRLGHLLLVVLIGTAALEQFGLFQDAFGDDFPVTHLVGTNTGVVVNVGLTVQVVVGVAEFSHFDGFEFGVRHGEFPAEMVAGGGLQVPPWLVGHFLFRWGYSTQIRGECQYH